MVSSSVRQVSTTVKNLYILPIFLVSLLLPFFEGGETSLGIFLTHTVVLVGLAAVALHYSSLAIPKPSIWLLFLFVLFVSTITSQYKFASFLKFWDFTIAALWAILVCTIVYHNQKTLEIWISWMFIIIAACTLSTILLYNTKEIMRLSASFVNPNDYASFALVLVCFGIYCFEREPKGWRKTLILTLFIPLLLSVALSSSRGIFVAVVALVIAVFLKHRFSKVILGILAGLVLISALMIALRFKMYEDPLRYYRLKIWKTSLQAVIDSPYLGAGLGMLEHQSDRFNFPMDSGVGRFRKIARTADNQYVQILVETGFLGFFAFLIWWMGMGYAVWRFSFRSFYLGIPWLVLSVTGLFSLPLENTSILLLFIFLVVIGETTDLPQTLSFAKFGRAFRIAIPVACFLLFLLGTYFPYVADREFHLAIASKKQAAAEDHLLKALSYNPYQPYYRFYFIRPLIDAKPNLSRERWMAVVATLDKSIALNPEEYEFHLYKARVLRNLLLQDPSNPKLYSSAVSAYQNALDCSPYNVFLRLEFASFLAHFGHYNQAASEAQKCLEQEPAFLNCRLFLVEMLLELNRGVEAKAQYARFQQDIVRYQKDLTDTTSSYVRELLTVNQKQKQKLEELIRPF